MKKLHRCKELAHTKRGIIKKRRLADIEIQVINNKISKQVDTIEQNLQENIIAERAITNQQTDNRSNLRTMQNDR